MSKLKWEALAVLFAVAAVADIGMALGIQSAGVAALGMVPTFAAGWCAGKASWS